jgi:hypothetical protein
MRKRLCPGNNTSDCQHSVALRPGTTNPLHLEAKEVVLQPMVLASQLCPRPVASQVTPKEPAFRRRPAHPAHPHQDHNGQA